MSKTVQMLSSNKVSAALNLLETQAYMDEATEGNKDVLLGTYQPGSTSEVEDRLKLKIQVIMSSLTAQLKELGFEMPKPIFNIYAFGSEDESKITDITISVRTKLTDDVVIKEKLKNWYDETLYASFKLFIGDYLAQVFSAYAALKNIEVMNNSVQTIADESETPVPFKLGFELSQDSKPVVSVTPEELILGVDAIGALNVAPNTGLQAVAALKAHFEDKEEAEEAANIAAEEAAEEARIAAEEEAKEAEEARANMSKEELATLKDLEAQEVLNKLALKLNKDEDVDDEAPTTFTPEEKAAKEAEADEKFHEIMLTGAVDAFVADLLAAWTASTNPLEFIRAYDEELMSVVAGHVTHARARKVLPLLKDSAALTMRSLELRNAGSSVAVTGEGEDKVAEILTKMPDGSIETTYPKFNVTTLAFA